MEYRVGDVEGIEEELRIEYAYLTRMNHRMLDDEGWRYYEDYQEPPDYGSEEASPRQELEVDLSLPKRAAPKRNKV